MNLIKLFIFSAVVISSTPAFASRHNLTSQALGSAMGLFNLEYSYRICDHITVGLSGTNGRGTLGSLTISGSSYGIIFRRYFEPALENNSWFIVASTEHRNYTFTLHDNSAEYLGETRAWVTSAGGGYQWFWSSFNIGLGVLITNQNPIELKTKSGATHRDKLNPGIGLDFTIGGKF